MAEYKTVPVYMEAVVRAALEKVSSETILNGISFKKTEKDDLAPRPSVFISVDRGLATPEYNSDTGNYGSKSSKQYVALYADVSISDEDIQRKQLLKTEANRVQHLLEMAIDNIPQQYYVIDNSAYGFYNDKIEVASAAVIDRIPNYEDHHTKGKVIVIAEILYTKTYQ